MTAVYVAEEPKNSSTALLFLGDFDIPQPYAVMVDFLKLARRIPLRDPYQLSNSDGVASEPDLIELRKETVHTETSREGFPAWVIRDGISAQWICESYPQRIRQKGLHHGA